VNASLAGFVKTDSLTVAVLNLLNRAREQAVLSDFRHRLLFYASRGIHCGRQVIE